MSTSAPVSSSKNAPPPSASPPPPPGILQIGEKFYKVELCQIDTCINNFKEATPENWAELAGQISKIASDILQSQINQLESMKIYYPGDNAESEHKIDYKLHNEVFQTRIITKMETKEAINKVWKDIISQNSIHTALSQNSAFEVDNERLCPKRTVRTKVEELTEENQKPQNGLQVSNLDISGNSNIGSPAISPSNEKNINDPSTSQSKELTVDPPMNKNEKPNFSSLRDPLSDDSAKSEMATLIDSYIIENGLFKSSLTIDQFSDALAVFNGWFKTQHEGYDQSKLGYAEKLDLNQNSEIFVKADLHGNGYCLLKELEHLKKIGKLNNNYECQGNFQMIFLGDYCDRGDDSLEILHILMTLKKINGNKITLIRGNHESIALNQLFNEQDSKILQFLNLGTQEKQGKNRILLDTLYQTMPQAIYISQLSEKTREYTLFTHGMIELTFDPRELLKKPENYAFMPIQPSLNITSLDIANPSEKLTKAANKINDLSRQINKYVTTVAKANETWVPDYQEFSNTDINNDDLNNTKINSDSKYIAHGIQYSAKDVKYLFRLLSRDKDMKIKMAVKGHQHDPHVIKIKTKNKEYPFIITLPYAHRENKHLETFALMTVNSKIRDWNTDICTLDGDNYRRGSINDWGENSVGQKIPIPQAVLDPND